MFLSWVTLATDATMLTIESQSVIWARLSQMALGRGSPAENLLMVTEKFNAFAEAAATIAAARLITWSKVTARKSAPMFGV